MRPIHDCGHRSKTDQEDQEWKQRKKRLNELADEISALSLKRASSGDVEQTDQQLKQAFEELKQILQKLLDDQDIDEENMQEWIRGCDPEGDVQSSFRLRGEIEHLYKQMSADQTDYDAKDEQANQKLLEFETV